ncbi:Sacsin, partial [Geodia barretti]
MTDLPMVISRKYVGITDPHRGLQVVPEGGAGIQIKLDEFMKHQSHAVCFSGVFEMSAQVVDYRATLFRFPLRTDDAVSKISKNCYTPDKVLGNLFASLQEEASILLLFLRNVVKVSMYEWNETTHSPDCLFRIEINGNIRKNREGCTNLAKCYNKTSSKTSIIISSMSTTTCEPPAQSYKVHNWLVMNAIGSDCGELRERAQKTSVLPWVGIAAPTLGDLNIQALQFELHDISSGSESFEELLSKLSGQTQKIVFEDS